MAGIAPVRTMINSYLHIMLIIRLFPLLFCGDHFGNQYWHPICLVFKQHLTAFGALELMQKSKEKGVIIFRSETNRNLTSCCNNYLVPYFI